MTLTVSAAHNIARLEGTLAFIDQGDNAPLVQLYDGPRPAGSDDAPSANNHLLVAIPLAQPAGAISGDILQLIAELDGLILLTGTPTWARLLNGAGAPVLDCDAGQGAGAWELQLAQAELYEGGDAKIVSFALT